MGTDKLFIPKKSIEIKYLSRYTRLPRLLDILHHRALTLVDPSKWEDTNDSYFMELYKKKLGKKSVLALCFAQYETSNKAAEKYHHWEIYSGNIDFSKTDSEKTDGVCIQFKKDELIRQFKANLGNSLHCRQMKYKKIETFEKNSNMRQVNWRDLPFIKRIAFNDEREYRFIYESNENEPTKDVPIALESISRITFSPWIPEPAYEKICKEIRKVKGCRYIDIKRSTCLNYKRWKKVGEMIANLPATEPN